MLALEVAGLPIHRSGPTRPQLRTVRHTPPARRCHARHPASVLDSGRCNTDLLHSTQPLSRPDQTFCSVDLARSIARLREPALSLLNGFLIMFRIVCLRSRKRDPHAAGMQEVSMRPFTSPIHKPMLFHIRNELSNLPRHIKLPSKTLQSNAKLPKFVAAIAPSPERTPRSIWSPGEQLNRCCGSKLNAN